MVILKKIFLKKVRASSLTEVLVASVLILIIFGIAVVTLDTTLQNSVNKNTHEIETELQKLQYFYNHEKITLPYNDEIEGWQIYVEKITEQNQQLVLFKATHKVSKKETIKKSNAIEIN